MPKVILLVLAFALVACSDNDKLSGSGKVDAGHEDHGDHDGGTSPGKDAGEAPASSDLDRPPGSLPRPPGNKLPDDLKPPGYGK